MDNRKPQQKELEDKALKARNAREMAQAPDASERDKADLKLTEQDLVAEKLKARRRSRQGEAKASAPDKSSKLADRLEKKLDAALKDSFPGSDPVSFVEAAPIQEGDHDLTSVKVNDQQAGAPKEKRST